MPGVRFSADINEKNPHSAFAKAGWLSLAVFLKRPQADSQIGAGVTVVKQRGPVNILFSVEENCQLKTADNKCKMLGNKLPGYNSPKDSLWQ